MMLKGLIPQFLNSYWFRNTNEYDMIRYDEKFNLCWQQAIVAYTLNQTVLKRKINEQKN